MGILIRELVGEDYPQWRAMALDYDPALSAQLLTDWHRLREDSSKTVSWIAEIDEQVCAFMHFTFQEVPLSRGLTVYLAHVYVKPEFRRRGVLRTLLWKLIQMGEKCGWARIYWHTEFANVARTLYDEAGICEFVRYHIDFKNQ